MSLFSWLAPRKKAQPPPESSGLSRMDSTRPFNAPRSAGTAQPGNRKQERMARRELLYGVVRAAMVHAGVLSSSYKFKVLSLDARGRQFMVMVDLAQGAGNDTTQLAEIEAMIAQSAKYRHDILVSAVYWRSNEHVAVGDPAAHAPGRAPVSRPAPLQAQPAAAAPLPPVVVPPVVVPPPEEISRPAELSAEPLAAPARYEPLHPTEVEAFKRALALGVSGREAMASASPGGSRQAAQSYTLLTGFEDTEMAETPEEAERLSGTQYGELR